MTKKTTKSRSTSRTTKSRAKTTKKKTGFRPVHHAKRLIKITPKFVHGAIIGGIVGVFLVVGLRAHAPVNAQSSNCGVLAVNLSNGQGYFKSFTTSGSTATANFDISGGAGCNEAVTVAVWRAPYGSTNFQPYAQQVLLSTKTANYNSGNNSVTVSLPDCDYQVDVLRGIAATGPDGTANYVYPQIVDWLQAGNVTCEPPAAPTPKPTVVTTTKPPITPPPNTTPIPLVTTPTPTPTVVTAAQTTTTPLPNTGPGAVIVVFIAAVIGGALFHHFHRHIKHKKKLSHHA